MVNYSFSLITVRPDTLADMVSHMTKSVGLVHQMPFACDRTGLPATLEKVIIWLTSLISRFCLCFCQKACALLCFHRAPFDKNVNKNKVVHTLASLDYVNFATRMSHEKKDKKRSRWRLKFFYQVSKQVLDRNLAKNLQNSIDEKFVKVCLHSSKSVQISLQFDDFFEHIAQI